jgi:hypothetical protein
VQRLDLHELVLGFASTQLLEQTLGGRRIRLAGGQSCRLAHIRRRSLGESSGRVALGVWRFDLGGRGLCLNRRRLDCRHGRLLRQSRLRWRRDLMALRLGCADRLRARDLSRVRLGKRSDDVLALPGRQPRQGTDLWRRQLFLPRGLRRRLLLGTRRDRRVFRPTRFWLRWLSQRRWRAATNWLLCSGCLLWRR